MVPVVWVGRSEAGVRGLQLEPCLQGTVTLMEYPQNDGCFGPVGSQVTQAMTYYTYPFLIPEGACYPDPHSKLVFLNENKFGIFGI